jgi:hypothetical protein
MNCESGWLPLQVDDLHEGLRGGTTQNVQTDCGAAGFRQSAN